MTCVHTMTKKRLVYGALGAVVMLTIVQLAWPQDRLPLFTTVDSVNLSGQGRSSAIEMLRNAYKQHEIEIFLGSSNEAVVKTNLAKAGVTVDVDEMVAAGVTVALGTDNIQDVYKPFSDGNLEIELRTLLEVNHLYDTDILARIASTNGLRALHLTDYERLKAVA